MWFMITVFSICFASAHSNDNAIVVVVVFYLEVDLCTGALVWTSVTRVAGKK